jgi:hypothetical protein
MGYKFLIFHLGVCCNGNIQQKLIREIYFYKKYHLLKLIMLLFKIKYIRIEMQPRIDTIFIFYVVYLDPNLFYGRKAREMHIGASFKNYD